MLHCGIDALHLPPAKEIMNQNCLQREDCTIAYETLGSGAHVFLCHGFGLDRESMRPLANAIAGEFTAVLFDWRGHGETKCADEDEAYSYPIMCGDLIALMDHLGANDAHLIGHSMGGQIALMAAIEQPQRMRSLTAIAAGPCRKITDPKEEQAWINMAKYFEDRQTGQTTLALWNASHVSPNAAVQPDADALFGNASGPALARMIRGAFLRVESNDAECAAVQTPSLVIAGAEDKTWVPASKKLFSLLPNCRIELVKDAGHLVHLEQPEIITHCIFSFLREHRS